MTRERFQQITLVRLSLEGLAVELAAARLGGAEIDLLHDCLLCMEQALERRDIAAYLQDNSPEPVPCLRQPDPAAYDRVPASANRTILQPAV